MLMQKKNLKPIMISGYYGFGNSGDEAILMTMIQELSKIVSKDKIYVLSQKPKETSLFYKVNAIYRLDFISMISQIKKSSIFISGGGGLLQDVSGKGFSIIYYLGLIIIARLFKIPTVIFAQGIGPIRKRFNVIIINSVLKHVQLIMVRDEQSKNILESSGIKNIPISVNPDVSFLLNKKELSKEIFNKYNLNKTDKKEIKLTNIGIVIRDCKELRQDYDNKIMKLAEISDFLITKYKTNLIFIPFQFQNDITIIKDVINRMKLSKVKILEEELKPDELLTLIYGLSAIIGMRLHSIIFATIANKPFIAVEYDPKVKYFVDSLGLNKLLIKLDELTVKNIDNKLKYIETNQEMIISKIKTKKIQFEKDANNNIQNLYQFIDDYCYREEFVKN